MSRTTVVRLTATALAVVAVWAAHTQGPQSPPQLKLNKIADDLYEIEGDGGNVAVYVTQEGVILIDDKFDRDYAEILAKVRSLTNKPLRYVLNTHQHGDHTGGNAKMLDASVEILAQKNARANMVAGKMPGLPRITFNDETEVFLGGKEVRARYFGRGHTNGDAVIYFPETRPGRMYAIRWGMTRSTAMSLDAPLGTPGIACFLSGEEDMAAGAEEVAEVPGCCRMYRCRLSKFSFLGINEWP
jgi:hypothetical protein